MARRNVTIWLVIYAVLALLAACGGQGAATSEPASGESPAPPKAGTAATDGKVNIELYVMSECPFGKGAEGVVQKVAVVLPGVLNVEIGFILNETETPGVFESLHGEEEVALDRVQACVGLLYPERQLEFITHDNQTPEPWADAAKAMSFDEEEIRKCVRDGRADEVLTRDARRTEAQTINASPTMFVNGEPYEKSINSLDFFETVCAALGDKAPAVCASPPAALSRSDGISAGRCGGGGEAAAVDPDLVDQTAFTHIVLYAGDAFSNHMNDITAQTKSLFPNVTIEQYDIRSEKGKELAKKYEVTQLPAFVFPKEIEKVKPFDQMKPFLLPFGDAPEAYLLNPRQIGANFFSDRERVPGRLELLYTPLSEPALSLLLDALDVLEQPAYRSIADKVLFEPAARLNDDGELIAQLASPELEEMRRHIGVFKIGGRSAYRKYLDARRRDPLSSYWDDFVKKAGLDPDRVKTAARSEETQAALKTASQTATDLGLQGDLYILVENRELADVRDKDDFIRLLNAVYGKN